MVLGTAWPVAKHPVGIVARLAAGVAFLAMCTWLICESPPREALWRAILAELNRGTIGHLNEEQTSSLLDTLDWLKAAAGVIEPIVLNADPSPGCLHVYTTTPEAISATGCARGNAVYDAFLDTIFIDDTIINPTALPTLGAKGRR